MEVLASAEGQVRVGYSQKFLTLVVEMPVPGMVLLPRKAD